MTDPIETVRGAAWNSDKTVASVAVRTAAGADAALPFHPSALGPMVLALVGLARRKGSDALDPSAERIRIGVRDSAVRSR